MSAGLLILIGYAGFVALAINHRPQNVNNGRLHR
jgi:hypothetical protein